MSTIKNNDKSKQHASIRSVLNDSGSLDRNPAVIDDDECNLINKDDFEEGK